MIEKTDYEMGDLMNFSEKPNLEEIREKKAIHAYEYIKYRGRFLTSTIAGILVILYFLANGYFPTKRPEPTPNDIVIAKNLTTLEGREAAIDEKYDGANITKESTYGKDIISVFETDDMHSFCIFEAIEDGYWMEYCGDLFPKTELVKGTVYLGDNTHEYDIYLQGADTDYTHLSITLTYRKHMKYKDDETVRFDENGIGIMKIDYKRSHYLNPRIEAYDAEGNQHLLDKGGIF